MKRLLSAIILTLIISIRLEAQTPITIHPTDPNVGVILGDVVNVRQQPSAASPLIDTVKENDYVKILGHIKKQETIGKFTDIWVHIKTKNGKEGYLFGAFVFELQLLVTNNYWIYNAFPSDVLEGVKFFNDKFIYRKRSKVGNKEISGSFKIEGRKIFLTPCIPISCSLFLMKFKGKYILESEPKNIAQEYEIDSVNKSPKRVLIQMQNFNDNELQVGNFTSNSNSNNSIHQSSNLNEQLIEAVSNKNYKLVKELISRGANVNTSWGLGWNVLISAANGGSLQIVKLLVDKGAILNTGENGGTALAVAAGAGNYEIVKYLLSKNAAVGGALHFASGKGHIKVIKLLLDNGVKINEKVYLGGVTPTALWAAASKGKLAVVKYLFGRGADINLAEDFGNTPLIIAVRNGHIDTVKYLISKGAKINITDKNNQTALDWAIQTASPDIISILKAAGARSGRGR